MIQPNPCQPHLSAGNCWTAALLHQATVKCFDACFSPLSPRGLASLLLAELHVVGWVGESLWQGCHAIGPAHSGWCMALWDWNGCPVVSRWSFYRYLPFNWLSGPKQWRSDYRGNKRRLRSALTLYAACCSKWAALEPK